MKRMKIALAAVLSFSTVATTSTLSAHPLEIVSNSITYTVASSIIVSVATLLGMSYTSYQNKTRDQVVAQLAQDLSAELGEARARDLLARMNNCELLDATSFADNPFTQNVLTHYEQERLNKCR